jgi:repressor LexA
MVPTRGGGRALELPLLGFVAAGEPIEAIASAETIAVPEDFVGKRDTYVLKVRGDSMIEAGILDGDTLIVEARDGADDGAIVVALIDEGEATVKRLAHRKDGSIQLTAANAAMAPMIYGAERVRIQGVVVGVLRSYR